MEMRPSQTPFGNEKKKGVSSSIMNHPKSVPPISHLHLLRVAPVFDASNNSIGFTYGYLRFTPLGLGIFV